jgi:methylmalonyl-CoA mutase C-terminal domain/subunit
MDIMNSQRKKIRVLLARLTLDGHDRGLVALAHNCREAGMEVVYIRFNTAQEIIKAAQEEDVDLIGVTSSIGQHFYVASSLMQALKSERINIPVIFGGVISSVDIPRLMSLGVARVFGPGTSPRDAVTFIQTIVQLKGGEEKSDAGV